MLRVIVKANSRETEGETEETKEEWDSMNLGKVFEKEHGQDTLYLIHEQLQYFKNLIINYTGKYCTMLVK